jgi:hypothetical protein
MFTKILHLLWRPSGFAFGLGVECRCSSPLFAAGREGSDCFLFWILLAIFEVLLLIVVFLIGLYVLCVGVHKIFRMTLTQDLSYAYVRQWRSAYL